MRNNFLSSENLNVITKRTCLITFLPIFYPQKFSSWKPSFPDWYFWHCLPASSFDMFLSFQTLSSKSHKHGWCHFGPFSRWKRRELTWFRIYVSLSTFSLLLFVPYVKQTPKPLFFELIEIMIRLFISLIHTRNMIKLRKVKFIRTQQ